MANIDYDRIRKSVDIVSIISSYIPLTKKGKSYVGLCPFHDDKNPSLSVSPERQCYKCFSCGAAGNVFTFVQDFEKISFIESVKKVAQLGGLSVPELDNISTFKEEVSSQDTLMYNALTELSAYYTFQLNVLEGQEGMNYLTKRKIGANDIEKFQIGYSPVDGQKTIKYLQYKGYTLDTIIAAGIGNEFNGVVYDRMAGRVTFAITDTFGRVVAFSGRRINEALEQKYLNTPETPLFHKGEILYNYYLASKYSKRAGYVYIVEGFMDAIALSKVGIDSVVATMGTALTHNHVDILKRLNCEIRLLFDSDNPGQMATYKALDIFENSRCKLKVVKKLRDGKDTDQILNELGKDVLIEDINNLINPLDFRLNYLGQNYNMENYDDRKKYVAAAVEFINKPGLDELDRDNYVKAISAKTNFSKNMIQSSMERLAKKAQQSDISESTEAFRTINQKRNIDRYELASRQLIKMMFDDSSAIVRYKEENLFVYDDVYRKIIIFILDRFNRNGEVHIADLASQSNELFNVATEITDDKYKPEDISDLIKIIRDEQPKKIELKKLFEVIEEINNTTEQAKLGQKYVDEKRELNSKRYVTKRKN